MASDDWKLLDRFSPIQAAYLWKERDPPANAAAEERAGGRPAAVAAILQSLENAITDAFAPARLYDFITIMPGEPWCGTVSSLWLREFAEERGERPSFLFSAETGSATKASSVNKGGRPPTYDWDGCMAEIVRIADEDSLPAVQNDLVRQLQAWFQQTHDDDPAESEIKRRVSAVYKRLTDAGWKPRNG